MVLLKSTCDLMAEIAGLKSELYLQDVTIHCKDGDVKTSGVLLAAANDFWNEVLSSAASEEYHVFLKDEEMSGVQDYVSMLWNGKPLGDWNGRLLDESQAPRRRRRAFSPRNAVSEEEAKETTQSPRRRGI